MFVCEGYRKFAEAKFEIIEDNFMIFLKFTSCVLFTTMTPQVVTCS